MKRESSMAECKQVPFRMLSIAAVIIFVMVTPAHVDADVDPSDAIDGSEIDKVGEQVMQMNGNEFRSVRRTVLENFRKRMSIKAFLAEHWTGLVEQIGNMFRCHRGFLSLAVQRLQVSGRSHLPPQPPSGSFDWNFGLGSLSSVFTIAMIAVIAVVLIVIIAMVVKSIDAKKRSRENLLSDSDDVLSDVTSPPGELAASTYESRAVQFASAGNYRAAIRELLLGSMSWIERAGLIRYRKGLTNRDYVRSVWRRTDKREGYLTTASQFEFVYFGRRTPTAEMFEQRVWPAFREPSVKKKRRLLQSDTFWGGLVLLLIILQFWWLPGEDGSASDSYSTTVDGKLGLYRTLSQLFPRVERDALLVAPEDPGCLVLIAPDRYPNDQEQQQSFTNSFTTEAHWSSLPTGMTLNAKMVAGHSRKPHDGHSCCSDRLPLSPATPANTSDPDDLPAEANPVIPAEADQRTRTQDAAELECTAVA